MSMCGFCWFDGRALTDERDDLRDRIRERDTLHELAQCELVAVQSTLAQSSCDFGELAQVNEALRAELATLQAYVGSSIFDSDYPSVTAIRIALTKCDEQTKVLAQENEALRAELETAKRMVEQRTNSNVMLIASRDEVRAELEAAKKVIAIEREAKANLLKSHRHVEDLLTAAEKERDALRAAIEKTIEENGHLADGDDCTLIHLVRAIARPPTESDKPTEAQQLGGDLWGGGRF